MTHPPVCDYEGSDYQSSFWERGGREYEDCVEEIALRRLLPKSGELMLELGAGAGRNTLRYAGFKRIVLLDYSRTQLEQAQGRLGTSDRYVYVAADVYRLPFAAARFDGATMIRTLHHMKDAPAALTQVRDVLRPGAVFILEYANKLNLKAILRYWLQKQKWSPFTLEPVEFVDLNFDFHPAGIRRWLRELGFTTQRTLTVSHFRVEALKRAIPTGTLVFLDSLFQWTGAWWQLTPSVFVRAISKGIPVAGEHAEGLFKCPRCGHTPLEEHADHLKCPSCRSKWAFKDGIYDFREPVE